MTKLCWDPVTGLSKAVLSTGKVLRQHSRIIIQVSRWTALPHEQDCLFRGSFVPIHLDLWAFFRELNQVTNSSATNTSAVLKYLWGAAVTQPLDRPHSCSLSFPSVMCPKKLWHLQRSAAAITGHVGCWNFYHLKAECVQARSRHQVSPFIFCQGFSCTEARVSRFD